MACGNGTKRDACRRRQRFSQTFSLHYFFTQDAAPAKAPAAPAKAPVAPAEAPAAPAKAPAAKRKAAPAADAPAPPAAEAPATPAAAPAPVAAPAATTTATADVPAPEKKKRRKKKKKGAPATAALPSGPGNADEAARIRAALGFSGGEAAAAVVAPEKEEEEAAEEEEEEEEEAAPAAPAPAPAALIAAPPPGTFAFGFAKAAGRPVVDVGEGALDAAAAAAAIPTPTPRFPPPPPIPGLARRVFVGGMPFGYEEEDVRAYWEWCGPVASMDLMRFPDTGRFRGIAFITFATEEGYRKALECDGTLLDGVRVKVEPCKKGAAGGPGRPGAGRGGSGGAGGGPSGGPGAEAAPKTPGYCVAYVGNIAFEAGPAEVAALFAGCGAGATRVRLHTDRLTGASRGYAHVHFGDEAGLDAAVAAGRAGRLELCGRAVKVGYAQPKAEHAGGGGGGGGDVVTPVAEA